MYQIGYHLQLLQAPWNEIEQAWLTAYDFWPARAEPLYAIAQHYWETNDTRKAYEFAKQCFEKPFPFVKLWISKEIYDYKCAALVANTGFMLLAQAEEEFEQPEIRMTGLKALTALRKFPNVLPAPFVKNLTKQYLQVPDRIPPLVTEKNDRISEHSPAFTLITFIAWFVFCASIVCAFVHHHSSGICGIKIRSILRKDRRY